MVDAGSSDPATLLTIPAEMQKAIADVTDNQGLLALRLVNKEIHAAVDDSFLERFFTTRRHIMTHYGLVALLNISMRPNLTRKLEEIVLVYLEVSFEMTYEGLGKPPTEQSRLMRDLVDSRWEHERQELFESRQAVRILTHVLTNLGTRRPKVTVADGFSVEAGTIFGRRMLQRSFDLTSKGIEYGYGPFDVQVVLKSIEAAGFPIDSLDLFLVEVPWGYCLQDAFGVAVQTPVAPCWTTLRSLSLHLPDNKDYWEFDEGHHVAAFVRSAINIANLKLKNTVGDGLSRYPVLTTLGEAFRDHALRNVEMHDFEAEPSEYLHFFKPHDKTLKSLVLTENVLWDECWSKIFAFFHDHFGLQHIVFENLRRRRYSQAKVMIDGDGRTRIDFQGEELIIQELGQLTAEKLRYGYEFLGKALSRSQ